jgi:hypothetical protein
MILIYYSIPPVKEWPGVVSRAIIGIVKGIKLILKAFYIAGKYVTRKRWEEIKAIPLLIKTGVRKLWSGLIILAFWLQDLLFKFVLFSLTLITVVSSHFYILSSRRLLISSAPLLLSMSLMASR